MVLAAALLRLAVAAETGTAPGRVDVERRCPGCGEPHWRPTLPGTGLHASVSHSGDLVAVALTRVAPVGVDVEQVVEVDTGGLARTVLHPDEPVAGPDDFFVYWTRKEAVVKATGDGIAAGLRKVRVSPPHQPPALLAYPGRPELAAHLVDLSPGGGYRAAVAVLADHPVAVGERSAEELLGGYGHAHPVAVAARGATVARRSPTN